MLQMLAHRTHIVVLISIVIHVLGEERVVTVLAMILRMEHVVLHIWHDAQSEHMCIVLLAAVAGVRAHLVTLHSISAAEGCQERYQRTLVRRPPEDIVVGDELVLSGYLYVITRFCLAVVHRVLLHAHERGVRVSLAVAVPVSKYVKLVLVLLHLGSTLGLHLLNGLPHFLVADAILIHLLQYAVCPLCHLRCRE